MSSVYLVQGTTNYDGAVRVFSTFVPASDPDDACVATRRAYGKTTRIDRVKQVEQAKP